MLFKDINVNKTSHPKRLYKSTVDKAISTVKDMLLSSYTEYCYTALPTNIQSGSTIGQPVKCHLMAFHYQSDSGPLLYTYWVSLFVCLFDPLRPINNLSVKQGQIFLGWTSTKLSLAQGSQRRDTGEARSHAPSVSSPALYHWATALPY